MKKVQKTLNSAERHCQERGAKLTTKRKQVLAGLVKAGKALSAYELTEVCIAESGESIPTMSVYRILDFLEEQHLVHKLNSTNKYVACAHITCDHAHEVPQFLICGKCQQVKEISVSKSTIDTLSKAAENAGFHLVSPQLEMDCVCEKCLKSAA